MNREIKFRGKCGNNWVYGNYVYDSLPSIYGEHSIMQRTGSRFGVRKETVGQFVGLFEGKEIYEGDIFCVEYCDELNTAVIEYCEHAFGFFPIMVFKDGYWLHIDWEDKPMWKTGNIHDNPELIKGECHNN